MQSSSVAAFAVSRTFRPSQPLARNASVGVPGASSRSITSSSRSFSPLSLSPHVRSTRLAITAVLTAARDEVGQHRPVHHVVHLVRHAGHRVDDLVDAVDDRPDR